MVKDLPRFYDADLTDQEIQTLRGDEAGHAIRVLRMKARDELLILNGQGKIAQGVIRTVSKKELQYEVLESRTATAPESGFHLAIAPTKNIDRLEWCLEKCTEVGLFAMTLIICQNSERRKVRLDRLQKRAISAMKQSQSLYLPTIRGPIPFEEFISEQPKEENTYIAHCRDVERESLEYSNSSACVLIGPEGDFSSTEVDLAAANGAKQVHLGDKRLRTETAALVACVKMNP